MVKLQRHILLYPALKTDLLIVYSHLTIFYFLQGLVNFGKQSLHLIRARLLLLLTLNCVVDTVHQVKFHLQPFIQRYSLFLQVSESRLKLL